MFLFSGDQVKGQVSIPLTDLGWLGKGRYLNGDATFNVSLESGVLIVTAREVRVKGQTAPGGHQGTAEPGKPRRGGLQGSEDR